MENMENVIPIGKNNKKEDETFVYDHTTLIGIGDKLFSINIEKDESGMFCANAKLIAVEGEDDYVRNPETIYFIGSTRESALSGLYEDLFERRGKEIYRLIERMERKKIIHIIDGESIDD